MEQKTKVTAAEGRQDMVITRDFDLPVEMLFRAYVEPGIIEQWMGTSILKWDVRKHGSYEMETSDPQGNVAFKANGVIHELEPNRKIIRTFEMENTPFGVQLEVYDFEPVGSDKSRLNMHTIYESVEKRDQVLKLPFAMGINMAHNRMEELMKAK